MLGGHLARLIYIGDISISLIELECPDQERYAMPRFFAVLSSLVMRKASLQGDESS